MAVPTDEGRALPIGVRLTHVGDLPELPMPPEMTRSFTERAGLSLPLRTAPATALGAIVDALTSLSWHFALQRRRPADWPAPPEAAGPGMDQLRTLAAETAATLPDSIADIAMDALAVLIDHVSAEADGAATVTLAGEIYDGQGLGPPPGTSALRLWDALSVVSASMMIVPGSAGTATT